VFQKKKPKNSKSSLKKRVLPSSSSKTLRFVRRACFGMRLRRLLGYTYKLFGDISYPPLIVCSCIR
jgi:hypothetical protein